MIAPHRKSRLLPAAAILSMVTFLGGRQLRAQEVDPAKDEADIQALLEATTQAFVQRDVKRIKESFVENFAGPFELPKLADRILNQMVRNAQAITADCGLGPMEIQGDRAVALVDADLVFSFGEKQQQHKGALLMWFVRTAEDWSILGFERLATDWELDREAASVVWEDEGLSFPPPDDWYGHPLRPMQARKAVVYISPDLKANAGVGVIGLPVPVTLQTIVDQQKGVGQLIPGARFVGEARGTLAGIPSVVTTIESKAGPAVTRSVTHMAIRGSALYAVSMSVSPAADTQQYLPVLEALANGLRFTRPAEPTPPVDDSPEARQYANKEFGLELTAPEGWRVHALDAKSAQGRGWLFAVSLKPVEGMSYVLVGARDLPQHVAPADLQQAEIGNLRSVVEDIAIEDEQDLQVGGKAARSWVCALDLGRKMKRREVLFMSGKRLFFVIADAVPVTAFPVVSPAVDEIIESIKITYAGE